MDQVHVKRERPGDRRVAAWQGLMTAPGRTGPVASVPLRRMLGTDHGDAVASLRVRATGDPDPGAYKATCPDGTRPAGLSRTGRRGLCTHAGTGALRTADARQSAVTAERYGSACLRRPGARLLQVPVSFRESPVGCRLRWARLSAAP